MKKRNEGRSTPQIKQVLNMKEMRKKAYKGLCAGGAPPRISGIRCLNVACRAELEELAEACPWCESPYLRPTVEVDDVRTLRRMTVLEEIELTDEEATEMILSAKQEQEVIV